MLARIKLFLLILLGYAIVAKGKVQKVGIAFQYTTCNVSPYLLIVDDIKRSEAISACNAIGWQLAVLDDNSLIAAFNAVQDSGCYPFPGVVFWIRSFNGLEGCILANGDIEGAVLYNNNGDCVSECAPVLCQPLEQSSVPYFIYSTSILISTETIVDVVGTTITSTSTSPTTLTLKIEVPFTATITASTITSTDLDTIIVTNSTTTTTTISTIDRTNTATISSTEILIENVTIQQVFSITSETTTTAKATLTISDVVSTTILVSQTTTAFITTVQTSILSTTKTESTLSISSSISFEYYVDTISETLTSLITSTSVTVELSTETTSYYVTSTQTIRITAISTDTQSSVRLTTLLESKTTTAITTTIISMTSILSVP